MRFASLALIGLAVVMIALGVWTVGGPEQARAERRDQQRMNDLSSLAHHLACLHRQGLEPDGRAAACPEAARRTDPLTGEPYRVDEVSEEFVRVCARFETRLSRHWWVGREDFDTETGCLVLTLRDTGRW
ncbi:MAG: hypothetical protein JJT95_14630 [Pararhodobacter sp.]|nr:hypothetical protein [Pararhodobacter sp.]